MQIFVKPDPSEATTVLGRARAEKLAAIEGITPSDKLTSLLEETKGLPAEVRRERIRAALVKT